MTIQVDVFGLGNDSVLVKGVGGKCFVYIASCNPAACMDLWIVYKHWKIKRLSFFIVIMQVCLLNEKKLFFRQGIYKYIDVWPVNFFNPNTEDPFDTSSLFMLQLACIIQMVCILYYMILKYFRLNIIETKPIWCEVNTLLVKVNKHNNPVYISISTLLSNVILVTYRKYVFSLHFMLFMHVFNYMLNKDKIFMIISWFCCNFNSLLDYPTW